MCRWLLRRHLFPGGRCCLQAAFIWEARRAGHVRRASDAAPQNQKAHMRGVLIEGARMQGGSTEGAHMQSGLIKAVGMSLGLTEATSCNVQCLGWSRRVGRCWGGRFGPYAITPKQMLLDRMLWLQDDRADPLNASGRCMM